jgi:hypothetical protein
MNPSVLRQNGWAGPNGGSGQTGGKRRPGEDLGHPGGGSSGHPTICQATKLSQPSHTFHQGFRSGSAFLESLDPNPDPCTIGTINQTELKFCDDISPKFLQLFVCKEQLLFVSQFFKPFIFVKVAKHFFLSCNKTSPGSGSAFIFKSLDLDPLKMYADPKP